MHANDSQVKRRVRNAFVRISGRAKRMDATQMCYCRFKKNQSNRITSAGGAGRNVLNTSLPGVDAPCPVLVLTQTGCRKKVSAAEHLVATQKQFVTVLLFTKAHLGSLLIL